MKNSSFGTLKFMKTSQSLGFWALFCLGIRFFAEILPGLASFCTHRTSINLPLLGSPPRGNIMSTLGQYRECFWGVIMGTFLGVQQIGVFNINF